MDEWWGVAVVLAMVGGLFYWPPRLVIAALSRLSGGRVLFFVRGEDVVVNGGRKMIALTIDDGPSPSTAKIQAVLDAHGAKATFFEMGASIDRHDPDGTQLRRLTAAGHELANHGYHNWPAALTPGATLAAEIDETTRRIRQHVPTAAVRWYRPSHAWLWTGTIATAGRAHLDIALGSNYPHDAHISNVTLNRWFVETRAQPGDVIVLHDRPWTPALLAELLPALRQRGFDVVTLSRLVSSVPFYLHRQSPDLMDDAAAIQTVEQAQGCLNFARRQALFNNSS